MIDKNELKPVLFISYSHDDIAFAKKLSERLKSDNYEIWIDLSDIHGNEVFSAEIEKGIFECAVFVSLISKTYIKKDFCRDEVECARNFRKELFPLHIEKVIIPPGSGFNLSFSKSQLGYGRDILSNDDFEELYNDFVESLELFLKTNTAPHKIKMNINFNALHNNFEQLSFSGYVLNEIHPELFPSITVEEDFDSENNTFANIKKRFKHSDNNKLLIDYIEKNSTSHIFIQGEGGSGKTVALKCIFENFITKEIPTIYVSLNKIGFGNDGALEKYISEIACKKAGWNNIKQLAMNNNYLPRVVLLLDGLNETTSDVREVIRQISEMMLWPNLQIIITSRADYHSEFSDTVQIKTIKLEPITRNTILRYLKSKNFDIVTDEKLLHLLSTPMMLTLYTETTTDLEYIYQLKNSNYDYNYFPIQVTERPDTSGKIIWNYIVSQLYKASNQSQSITDTINHFLIVELIMPFIGYNLISDNGKFTLTNIEFKKLIRSLNHSDCYNIYSDDRIEDFVAYSGIGYQMSTWGVFSYIMTNKLCLMKKNDDGLEFTHQIFRDFFAALFISKQIESLLPDNETNEYSYEAITSQVYSKYIIEYLVDILEETKAKPKQNSNGIIYPGKAKKLAPSELSIVENALIHFKGQEGPEAQRGVVNLFEIIKQGRHFNLSNCDFSKLDLRLCSLSNTVFVDWYKEKSYPCSFDDSYINIESFVSPGHTVQISAVCVYGDKIYSGDVSGNIKIWAYDGDYPLETHLITSGEPIKDIIFSPQKNSLGILTSHRLYSFSTISKTVEILCESHNYYKYVKVNENGEFLLSTDTEPLTWRDLSLNKVSTELPFGVTCGCVAKNPVKDEFLIGVLYNTLYLFKAESDEKYSISRRIDLYNEHAHLCDVCYSPDGKNFVVATNKTVTEFDSDSLTFHHRFTSSENISAVKYFNDKIVVACSTNIIILNSDFSLNKKLIGNKAHKNTRILLHNDELFIVSPRNKIIALSDNFTVKKARNIDIGSHICIGDHGKGESCFIIINDGNMNETGYRYNFETNELNELTFNYRIDTESLVTDDYCYEITKIDNSVIFTNKENIQDTKRFVFYPNIDIFDCSFKNVKGNLDDPKNLETIIMYGGII